MLVEIYRLFCQAYEIEFTGRDERFMRSSGVDHLCARGLDYRPFYGAKFFGQKSGQSTRFWGYADIEDLGEYKNDRRFQELTEEYLSKALRNPPSNRW